MNPRLLLRLAMLVRRPPGKRQLVMLLVVGALSLTIAGAEALMGGWPAWLTPQALSP